MPNKTTFRFHRNSGNTPLLCGVLAREEVHISCLLLRTKKRFFLKQSFQAEKQLNNMQAVPMNKFDTEEKEILEAFESGKLKQSKNAEKQIKQHKIVAEATFKKDARINIRLSSSDLRSLRAKAFMEGIPYQTLVSSVLHKFIAGQLVEKSADSLTSQSKSG